MNYPLNVRLDHVRTSLTHTHIQEPTQHTHSHALTLFCLCKLISCSRKGVHPGAVQHRRGCGGHPAGATHMIILPLQTHLLQLQRRASECCPSSMLLWWLFYWCNQRTRVLCCALCSSRGTGSTWKREKRWSPVDALVCVCLCLLHLGLARASACASLLVDLRGIQGWPNPCLWDI